MTPDPHERDRRPDGADQGNPEHPVPPPRLHHCPPGPYPWASLPLAAPLPEEEPAVPDERHWRPGEALQLRPAEVPGPWPPGEVEEFSLHEVRGSQELHEIGRSPGSEHEAPEVPQSRVRSGRRPYAAPYGMAEPRQGRTAQPRAGGRRRLVTRPDKLVASGRPRTPPKTPPEASIPRRASAGSPTITRLLVASLVLVTAAVLGLVVVNRMGGAEPTLAAGEGRSGDAAFAVPGRPGSSRVLNAITSVGSTIVAVGSDTTGLTPRPLFLVSTDGGRRWELGRVAGSAGHEPPVGAVGRVAGGAGRWLAVGTDAPARVGGAGGRWTGSLWVSADGRSWAAVDPDRLTPFASQDRIADVARTATGFLAVGVTVRKDGTAGPAAWVSPDGLDWTRVDAERIDPRQEVGGLRAVAARGDRLLALAEPRPGSGGSGSGGSRTLTLRSEDGGRTWARAAALPGVRAEPGALTVTKKEFLLVPIRQKTAAGDVRVYCSPDGSRWSRCGRIGRLGAEGTGVRGLTSSAAGVAVVAESAWERYAVYTSGDGRRWTRRAELGEIPGTLRGLTITDTGLLVASGDKRGPGDAENLPVLLKVDRGTTTAAAVPLEQIAGLDRTAREVAHAVAADGVVVAVGSANGDAAIWTSGDNGADWTTVGPPGLLGGPGRQALSGVAWGPAGWLAVGVTMSDPAVPRPLLATSPDGRTWHPGPEIETGSDHAVLTPRLVAAGPKGYVLAGEDHGPAGVLPALWFSPDLQRFTRVPARSMPAGGAGVRITDVTATPDGFVAVGSTGAEDREEGVVWVSADGLDWTSRGRVVPPGARSAGPRHVVATGSGGVVVLGTAVTGSGVHPFSAVTGAGGRGEWKYGTLPAEGTAAVFDVVVTGGRLIAVGSHGTPGEGDSAAWISRDGLDWSRGALTGDHLGGPGAQWLGTVAASGSQVVAIGGSSDDYGDHLTIWHGMVTEGDR